MGPAFNFAMTGISTINSVPSYSISPRLIVPEVSRSSRGTPFLRKGVPGGPAVVVLPRRRAGQVNGGGAGIFATMEAFVEHHLEASNERKVVNRAFLLWRSLQPVGFSQSFLALCQLSWAS